MHINGKKRLLIFIICLIILSFICAYESSVLNNETTIEEEVSGD